MATSVSKTKPKYDPDKELRQSWGKTMKYDGNRGIKDVLTSAAKKGNIDPALLLSSSWQEGMNKAVLDPDAVSEAYLMASEKDKSLEAFPVDGFYNYGLDTFGNNLDKLQKYLPQGFDQRYKLFDAVNEKKEKMKTAAFKTNEDALIAKAAFMNYEKDYLLEKAKGRGIDLSQDVDALNYLTLASYNGGRGNGNIMLDEYASAKDKKAWVTKGLTSRQGVHKNIAPRVSRIGLSNELLSMEKGGRMQYELGTEDPIDPLTGKPQLQNNYNSVFSPTGTSFPARPQGADALQMINELGQPVGDAGTVVPLQKSFETSKDKLGNTILGQETGYVSSTGRVNAGDLGASISAENAANALALEKELDNAEWATSTGITAINSFFNKKNESKAEREQARKAILNSRSKSDNPYLEGTGSQAIMEKGGKIDGGLDINILDGGKYKQISNSDHSNPMIEFNGREHKEGGIGVQFGQNVAEVENKEVGWVDDNGGLNIFGKLKFPGTNQTFRKVAKDIAKEESKVDSDKTKYLQILNNADGLDKYQETALSTAKVMFKSLDKKSKEIAEKKEGLASYQSLILGLAEQGGNYMEFGGRLDRDSFQHMTNGGKIGKIKEAIGKHESSGNYKARGPVVKKGRYKGESALGKYQVMPGNLKQWSKEAIGREVSEDEFLNSPELQDKIVEHRLTQMSKQYDDPKDLASVWFSGRPLSGNSSSDGNQNVPDYVKSVMRYYEGSSGEDPKPTGFKNFKNKKTGKEYKAPEGLDPQTLYKDPDVIKALKDDQTWPKAANDGVWGEEHEALWQKIPQAKKDELLQKSKAVTAAPAGEPVKAEATTLEPFTVVNNPMGSTDNSIETPHGRVNKQAATLSDIANIAPPDAIRGNLSPLALTQIAPELLSMATNKRQVVNQDYYDPELKQTFDLSYQIGRNENQSTFNQLAKIAESNNSPEMLSQLAAQKYQADQQYNMQEVQGNAQQKLQTYNANMDILNDAKLKNIALGQDQQMKQAQADFNTRKEGMAAFTSIAGKVMQNQLENKTYNAYANLFKHYGFDKKGNVTFQPDQVVTRFNAGEAQHFGMLAATKGAADLLSNATKTSTKTDGNGEVKSTTAINDELTEFNDIMQNRNLSDAQKQAVLKGNKYAGRLFGQ